jgi:hypothetical protein
MNNSAIPYPMLRLPSDQQAPKIYCIRSIQHHLIPPRYNYPSEDYTSQQLQRMTSTSKEEEEETQNNSKNKWRDIQK